jgi:hypothetical protein
MPTWTFFDQQRTLSQSEASSTLLLRLVLLKNKQEEALYEKKDQLDYGKGNQKQRKK